MLSPLQDNRVTHVTSGRTHWFIFVFSHKTQVVAETLFCNVGLCRILNSKTLFFLQFPCKASIELHVIFTFQLQVLEAYLFSFYEYA
jgi:hypothetical protein